MVTIQLNLTLIDIIGQKEVYVGIEQPTSLTDLLEKLGLPKEEVGIVIRNDRWSPIECIIEANDRIQLFPNLSGG